MPFTEADLPLVINLFADSTGVGKSFAAMRIRAHCEAAKIKTTLVRIETRGIEQKLRKGDVFIPVEDFSTAASMPGGLAGVLQPFSAAVMGLAGSRRLVIGDWAGGLAQHHAEYLVATHFGDLIAGLGIRGLWIFVTTARTEQMRQAAEGLRKLTMIAPGLQRALLLNQRFGGFKFIAGSQPSIVYRDLMRAADNCAVLHFPAIAGDSWKLAEDAGLTLREVMDCKPAAFAQRTGLDLFTAAACMTEIGAFHEKSEDTLNSVLRFRAAQ